MLCSVWLCFLETACARIFFFLEAPTSKCKNSLLVTRCALFWNTITFKHRRRAIGFGEKKFDNITGYYSVVRSGDTFRLYPWKIFMDYETRLCCKDDCWWITVRSWNENACGWYKARLLRIDKKNKQSFLPCCGFKAFRWSMD